MRQNILKSLVIGSLSFAAGCHGPSSPSTDVKVVGGQEAAAPSYFAALLRAEGNESFCGGAFIAPHVVLTAAHCVAKSEPLRIGIAPGRSGDASDPQRILSVKAERKHPAYISSRTEHDIALLFLDSREVLSRMNLIVPIALNRMEHLPESLPNPHLTIMGWGNASNFGTVRTDQMLQAAVPVVPLPTCRAASFRGAAELSDAVLCAGDLQQGGIDSCQGDSGGPAVVFLTPRLPSLVGIISWGDGCALAGKPGVYTRVSSYADWIEEEVRKFSTVEAAALTTQRAEELVRDHCFLSGNLGKSSKILEQTDQFSLTQTTTYRWHRFTEALQPGIGVLPTLTASTPCTIMRPGHDAFQFSITGDTGDAASSYRAYLQRTRSGEIVSGSLQPSVALSFRCGALPDGINLSLYQEGQDWQGVLITQGQVQMTRPWLDEEETPLTPIHQCQGQESRFVILENPSNGDRLVEIAAPALDAKPRRFKLAAVGGGRQSPEVLVRVTTAPNDPSTGQIIVTNQGIHPIYSWQITCPRAMELADNTGQYFNPRQSGNKFVYTVLHRDDPRGLIPPQESLTLRYRHESGEPSGQPMTCSFNSSVTFAIGGMQILGERG